MAQKLIIGERVEVQTPKGVWYRGTVICDGVWLDQLHSGEVGHKITSVVDIRKMNQPPWRLSELEMLAQFFPAGVGVMISSFGCEGQRWVVITTATKEHPALLFRFWWWEEESKRYTYKEIGVAAKDAFNILRRPGLPVYSKFFQHI